MHNIVILPLSLLKDFFENLPVLPYPLGMLHLSSRSSPLRGKEETAPPDALNRFAIRLTDHQRSRQRGCAGWNRLAFVLSHRTINKFYFI